MSRAAMNQDLFPRGSCAVDLFRFVRVEAISDGQAWRVGGVGRRAGEVGVVVGIVGLRHSTQYEVVLHFGGSDFESFRPFDLFGPEVSE